MAETTKTGEEAYVVSLTSWTKRTEEGTPGIWVTIESLMRQTVKPDGIILWLSKEEYPGRDADKKLPQTLVDLKKRGLEIRWTPGNTKALKKLLPALKAKIPANLVTADDDHIYSPFWLQWFQASHRKHPKAIHAFRAHRRCFKPGSLVECRTTSTYEVGFYDATWAASGGPGILYPYNTISNTCYGLDNRVIGPRPPYVDISDDSWWHVCRVLAGTPLRLVGCTRSEVFCTVSLEEPLSNLEKRWLNPRLLREFPEFAAKLGVDTTQEQCVPPSG